MNHSSSAGNLASGWSAAPRMAKIGLAAIALAAIPLAIGTFIPARDGKESLTSSIVHGAPLADMLTMLDQRSPGERIKGELADSKARKAPGFVPHQRALAKIRTPELPDSFIKPLFAADKPSNEVPVVKLPPLIEQPPLPDVVPPIVRPIPLPPLLPGPPPIVSGPGPDVPGPQVPPIPPVPPVTPAVPEPDTWALMLLGFGATGIALRRRRSARPMRPESASLQIQ